MCWQLPSLRPRQDAWCATPCSRYTQACIGELGCTQQPLVCCTKRCRDGEEEVSRLCQCTCGLLLLSRLCFASPSASLESAFSRRTAAAPSPLVHLAMSSVIWSIMAASASSFLLALSGCDAPVSTSMLSARWMPDTRPPMPAIQLQLTFSNASSSQHGLKTQLRCLSDVLAERHVLKRYSSRDHTQLLTDQLLAEAPSSPRDQVI